MLEIILVYKLAQRIGEIVREKGRTAWPFYLLFVAFWVGGEITGGIIGALLGEMFGWERIAYLPYRFGGSRSGRSVVLLHRQSLKITQRIFPHAPATAGFWLIIKE